MLKAEEARELDRWIGAARRWSQEAQEYVGAATELATISRDLADTLSEHGPTPLDDRGQVDAAALAADLRLLAAAVEHETRNLRDQYLATAARVDEYRELLA